MTSTTDSYSDDLFHSDEDASIAPGDAVRVRPGLLQALRGTNTSTDRKQPARAARRGPAAVVAPAVEFLRHRTFRLELQQFVRAPDPQPTVPQAAALSHWARREHNKLRSKELEERLRLEAARRRQESEAQELARDIARRHARTAHRYDTGSKYPPGLPELHAPQLRDKLVTLLQTRKLRALADAILTCPAGGLGVQPLAPGPPFPASFLGEGVADGAAVEDASGSVGDHLVSALGATIYALACFSPRGQAAEPEQRPAWQQQQRQQQQEEEGEGTDTAPVSPSGGTPEVVVSSGSSGGDHGSRTSSARGRATSDSAPGEADGSDAAASAGGAPALHGPRQPGPPAAPPAAPAAPARDSLAPPSPDQGGAGSSGGSPPYRSRLPLRVQHRLVGEELAAVLGSAQGLRQLAAAVLGQPVAEAEAEGRAAAEAEGVGADIRHGAAPQPD